MGSTTDCPKNIEESLVYHTVSWTFVFYIFGMLYVVGSVIGWVLFIWAFMKWMAGSEGVPARSSLGTLLLWLWFIGMLMMEVALIIGHLNFELGIMKIIKSTIGWAKGWMLFFIFIISGYLLNIRTSIIVRAGCRVAIQALFIAPFLIIAYIVGAPETLYLSPLKVIGGPGPEFFEVRLFEIEPGVNTGRWRFFAPWAPAAGLMANIYLVFALFEKDRKRRNLAFLGCLLMILLAKSRLGLIIGLFIPAVLFAGRFFNKTWFWIILIVTFSYLTFFMSEILEFINHFVNEVKAARADSTRVREALARIAIHRWETEAYWWGHGIVEQGPHLVEYMPIGSHHTWYGLLFVKGIVGALSMAIPLLFTTLFMACHFHRAVVFKMAFSILLILNMYSIGENLEILAYLFWPALIIIGQAIKPGESHET